MAAFGHHRGNGVFSRDMKTPFNHLPTQRRAAPVSCFMRGIDGLAVKDWPLSGRTTG